MFRPWPKLIKQIDGPRLWVRVDQSQLEPAIVVRWVGAEKYRWWIAHLAHLGGLREVADSRYEAALLDEVADTMVDLAFLNRHGAPEEGFLGPAHWRQRRRR